MPVSVSPIPVINVPPSIANDVRSRAVYLLAFALDLTSRFRSR